MGADETFGPLVSLYRYGSVDEAIDLANAGEYGLNASVWGPVRVARDIAPRIKAGTVNINEGFAASFGSIDAPMGGMRHSGMGRRQGAEGIHRYTEPQAVAVQRGVPVFVLPFIMQDLGRGRRSGFLIPEFEINDIVRTSSGYNRQITNVGFYWAINEYMGAQLSTTWRSGSAPRSNRMLASVLSPSFLLVRRTDSGLK